MAEQIIHLGIGPTANLTPFITTGLEIGAVANLETYTANVYVNLSPSANVAANISPAANVDTNPTPTAEVTSG